MPLIKPFRALRPAPGRAAEVLAPPYDVLSSAEARERAKGKPWSFLHISKPEIDLDPAINPYDPAVYAKAAENLKRMVDGGVLMRDAQALLLRLPADLARPHADRPRLRRLARRLRQQPHPQARAHNAGQGRRSRAPDRGDQRADRAGDDRLSGRAGRSTRCWPRRRRASRSWMSPPTTACATSSGWSPTPTLSQADQRLRCPAGALHRRRPPPLGGGGARGAAARKGDGSHQYFLSVMFPEREMTILDYNRVVKDLNGREPEQFLAELAQELHGRPVRRAGAPGVVGRIRHVSGRPLVPADAAPRLVPRRSDRPAADHAADPQRDRAAARHQRPAHRQAHRFRRRRARAGRAGEARRFGRDGGRLRALPDADGTT